MINLDELLEATAEIKFDFSGFQFEGVVRLNSLTGEWAEEVKDKDFYLVRVAEKIYKSTNIVVNNLPLEPTFENLKKYPAALVEKMVEEFREQRNDLKKK